MRILIIGAGQLGYNTAAKLSQEQHDVVVIEQNETRAHYLLEHLDVQVVTGSGSSPDVLKKAGVQETDILAAVTDSDEVNLVACLIAAAQAKTPRKIARIRNHELLKHSQIFGRDLLNVDYALNPEQSVVDELERLIEIPGSTDLAEFCRGKVVVAGFRIPESSVLVGPTLSELWSSGTDKKRFLLVAIERGRETIIPDGSQTIQAGDIVFVIHPADRLEEVYPIVGVRPEPVKMVIIAGGSRIAVALARRLQQRKDLTVKLISRDRRKCEKLADELENTLILCGDPHNEDLLREEGIDSCDVFFAAGSQDDTNVLVSMLASGMGADRVITLVNQVRYISLVQAVSNLVAVCPKLIAVSQIIQFIRRGRVLSLATFGSDDSEAMEVVALAGSKLLGAPLKSLKLPKGVIVGSILQGDQLIIPGGDTQIEEGDRVVLFAHTKSRSLVDKLLVGAEIL